MKQMEELINETLNMEALELLGRIDDESIDLVLTDPPYNMDYSGRGKINEFEGFANDNLTPEEHSIWFDGILAEMHRVMKQNSAIYVCIDYRNYARIYPLIEKYFTIKNCIVWDKMSIGMGASYRFQHEFIIYAVKGKPALNFVKRNVPDIWHCKRESGKYKHPTQKPLELMKLPIEYSSNRGDLVLDPFAGSFTTALACKQLDRNFISSEIDVKYCEIGKQRLNN